jgi:NodT family efflux transporter outer membrane factor (OMF) lipoprotein
MSVSMMSIVRTSHLFRTAAVSVLALAAAGCATPNPTALDKPADVPEAFTAPVVDKTAPVWTAADWWASFKADELPALEETAQKENLDINMAQARILESEASDEAAFAPLLPNISANGGYNRIGSNRSTPRNGGSNSFTAGLSGTYTVDLWGLNQDRLRQTRETLRGTRYAAALTGITVASTVANQYFTILALRERIAIARQNIAAAEDILAVTQAKVTAGVLSNLDLSQQQATVANQRSRLPQLIEQEREARYALAILLGRAPEGFDIKGQNLNGIVAPTIQPGLPSEVLLRRPDVAQAEASLYAAHANLDATRAAFFPQIGLTGQAGYSAATTGALINPAAFAWSFGASLLQSIFDGGAKAAANDLAAAQQVEQINNYRKVVFNAFSSVESALGSVQAINDQLIAHTEQLRASTEAFRIATLQYREGTIDITTLLNTEQGLFSIQDTVASDRLTRLQNAVTLYQQLGGGWSQVASDAAYTYQLDWWPL